MKSTIAICVLTSFAALAAACGGAPSAPQTPATATTTPGPTAPTGEPPPVTATPASSGAGAQVPPTNPAAGEQAFQGPMKPIAASTMAADLTAIGLDPKNLPPLDKMEPEKLRKVMRTFTKALGAKCVDCHSEGDFAAPTPMKAIAAHMWNDFSQKLAMDDGSPLYCDSCHQGRMKLLDRSDKKALSKWMDANFVQKVKRKDKKEHGCETCHGNPFEGDIFKSWTAAAPKR